MDTFAKFKIFSPFWSREGGEGVTVVFSKLEPSQSVGIEIKYMSGHIS